MLRPSRTDLPFSMFLINFFSFSLSIRKSKSKTKIKIGITATNAVLFLILLNWVEFGVGVRGQLGGAHLTGQFNHSLCVFANLGLARLGSARLSWREARKGGVVLVVCLVGWIWWGKWNIRPSGRVFWENYWVVLGGDGVRIERLDLERTFWKWKF